MTKIVIMAIVTVIAITICRKDQPGISAILGIAAGIFLMLYGLDKLSYIIATMKGLLSSLAIDAAYYVILLKVIGIALVGEMGHAICKDANCNALAEQIAMAARFSILAVSLPVLLALVEVMQGFA